ncbi:hypothetical protein [Pseudomonas triticicola]|uniref:hypothetical protein n=1 Tax=Pseudomonas triticicola TaxID=2842345 RepID=UPI003EB7115A
MSQDETNKFLEVPNATGTFVAFQDDHELFHSDVCVFAQTPTEFFIIGSYLSRDKVDLSIPRSLDGNGPHKVTYPTMGRPWRVKVNHFYEDSVKGELTVTFANLSRKNVKGTFALDLRDKRKVTGNFDLELDNPEAM